MVVIVDGARRVDAARWPHPASAMPATAMMARRWVRRVMHSSWQAVIWTRYRCWLRRGKAAGKIGAAGDCASFATIEQIESASHGTERLAKLYPCHRGVRLT